MLCVFVCTCMQLESLYFHFECGVWRHLEVLSHVWYILCFKVCEKILFMTSWKRVLMSLKCSCQIWCALICHTKGFHKSTPNWFWYSLVLCDFLHQGLWSSYKIQHKIDLSFSLISHTFVNPFAWSHLVINLDHSGLS